MARSLIPTSRRLTKRCPARDHKRELIAIHHDGLQVGIGRLVGDHAEIGPVVANIGRNAAGEPAAHRHRMAGYKRRYSWSKRQQIQARQLVTGDDQLPAAQVAHVLQRRQRLLFEGHEPLGVLEQDLAGVGQNAAAAGPIEQRLPNLVFQPADDLADSRLRPIQRLGGLREAAFPDDGHERLELEEIHRVAAL